MDKHNLEIAIKTANMYQFFFRVMLCNTGENKQKSLFAFRTNVEKHIEKMFSHQFATFKCFWLIVILTTFYNRWSAEGAWLRGMNSGNLHQDRMTSRQIRDRDIGPVHRVWYK